MVCRLIYCGCGGNWYFAERPASSKEAPTQTQTQSNAHQHQPVAASGNPAVPGKLQMQPLRGGGASQIMLLLSPGHALQRPQMD
jgi:hypothetical protein